LGFGWVDFDTAFEVGTVLDADAGGGNVADDGTIGFDIDAFAGVDISNNLAVDDHLAGVNFGIELCVGAYGKFVAVQRDRAIDLAVDLQGLGAGDLPFNMQAGAETRRIAQRSATKARVRRGIEWNDWCCCALRGRNGWRFSRSLLLGPHKTSLFLIPRMTIAPGGREQRRDNVVWERDGMQSRNGTDLRCSKTGPADRARASDSGELLNSIEETHQVFPGEIVDDERDRSGDRPNMDGKTGDGKVQQAGKNYAQRREKDRKKCSVKANRQLQALPERNKQNIPKPPEVWHDGHGKDDDTFNRNRNIESIAQNRITGHDEQQEDRRHSDAGEIRAKINVLIHKNLPTHK
jgi:hypothetical protein